MIRIDRISFEFTAPDEEFAYGLYAEWEGFCRACFEQVVEACCAAYDKEQVLHEIARLDLDLGAIPEEELHMEFPRRLKEELLKALPPLSGYASDETEKVAAYRGDNLLFFLKCGFPKPEWTHGEFNPSKEAEWLLGQSAAISMPFIKNAALLCLEREQVLRRLLWQTDNIELHLGVYAASLAEPSAGIQEKRRFLALMLEERPDIPVRFVHRTGSAGELQGMAALLDSPTVRQLMRTEMEEHAEVDLPPYWHYLYEWLIQYYPFNGLAVFGGKAEFIRHLHYRLLTFIRKRTGSPYLSKKELTLDFLLEVFGPAHYKEVLNAIYGLQPLNADGSPVYDGYFNREMYRILMQLSLLKAPATTGKEATEEKIANTEIPVDIKKLTAILKENTYGSAGKRALLRMTAKQQPGVLLDWLRSEATKDETFISLLSELADDGVINRLLAALSFAALETVETIHTYLERHSAEIVWLQGKSEAKRQSSFRKAVLLWITDEKVNGPETVDRLLCLIYREAIGCNEDTPIESLAEELNRMKIQPRTTNRDENKAVHLHRLQKILADASLPVTVKQMAVAEFWEEHKDNYAEAVTLLQERHLLPDAVRLTGQFIMEEIIRRRTIQVFGTGQATVLLPLFMWLIAHEADVSHIQATDGENPAARLLLWMATQMQAHTTTAEAIRSLFAAIWSESELTSIIKIMIKERIAQEEAAYGLEAILAVLQGAESSKGNIQPLAFSEWKHRQEGLSNAVRTLFEEHWNTADHFKIWLEDASVPAGRKRELLQTAVREHTREWIALLRRTTLTETTSDTIISHVPVAIWQKGMAKVNFYQASVLSRTIEHLKRHTDSFPFLTINGISLTPALSKAMLLYMRDADTVERTLTEREIIGKFLAFLYSTYTGQTDYRHNTGWKQLAEMITPEAERQGIVEPTEQDAAGVMSDKESPIKSLQDTLQSLMEREPEKLLAWLESDAGSDEINRIARVTDIGMLERWAAYLPTVAGFVNPNAFHRLAVWLLHSSGGKYSVLELAATLFAWIRETDWRRQTLPQMEEYFFARLYDNSYRHFQLPIEYLTDEELPQAQRKRLLQTLLRFQPEELLDYIRRSVSGHLLPLAEWVKWLDTQDWIYLAASLSPSVAELLRQVTETLHLDGYVQRLVWGSYLTTGNKGAEWARNSPEENIRFFVQTALSEQGQEEAEETVRRIQEELNIPQESAPTPEDVREVFLVDNAGLCLLTPWLVRLFGMLGYLDEEKKNLKDTSSKVRAVFLLQYTVYGEEREYRETELFFNRLLTGLSPHVPLPKRLPLADEEKLTIDSMVEGVKANWPQMKGTSAQGFRQSFIARSGRLEQQEERWLLSVEKKPHDLLLDSVPWSFKQIRLPWLKRHIQVVWNEKQEFD